MKKQFAGLIIVLVIFVFIFPVYAGAPLNVVEANVNKVLDVLRNPKLQSRIGKRSKKAKAPGHL